MTTTLVVGASGATGRLLVQQLLRRGQKVHAMVRSVERFTQLNNDMMDGLTVVEANILQLSDTELSHHIEHCQNVVSCLGHTLSFRGMFGHPRRLVLDATSRLCDAMRIVKTDRPWRFVLMNSAGVSNRDLNECVSLSQRCVIGFLRWCIPPHADNEQAADYLRTCIGQDDQTIEWSVVRPDTLINKPKVTDYKIHLSPIRSAIFNPGQTSRINIADFMARLICEEELWKQWKRQMPVIYNSAMHYPRRVMFKNSVDDK